MAINYSSDGLSVIGDGENDNIFPTVEVTFIDGGGGDDVIVYRNARDVGEVFGGPGNDQLSGFRATYSGGDDDDIIRIGRGSSANGGKGRDEITYTVGLFQLPTDTLSGGKGAGDELTTNFTLDGYNAGLRQILVDQALGRIEATDSKGVKTTLADISGFERIIGSGLSAQDTVMKLRGDAGKNEIAGGSTGDIIVGRGGDDTLVGTNGSDFINGGGGVDLIVDAGVLGAGAGSEILLARDSAPDTIKGGANGDYLIVSGGRDDVRGNGGDDFIFVAGQGTVVSGGAGRDHVSFFLPQYLTPSWTIPGSGFADWIENGKYDGGAGRDTLDFSRVDFDEYARTGVAIDLRSGAGEIIKKGNATATFSVTGFERLIGSEFDDTFQGTSKNEEFFGGRKGDFIAGGGGRDIIYGEGGNDRLKGDEGADTIFGGNGRDRIDGGEDFDAISLVEDVSSRDTVISKVNGGLDFVTGFEARESLRTSAVDTHDQLNIRDWGKLVSDYQLVEVRPDRPDPLTGALGQFGFWVLPDLPGVAVEDIKLGVFLSGLSQADLDLGNELILF